MEYLSLENIATAVVALMMIGCLGKIFFGDFGANKIFYFISLAALGFGLYFWRSGLAMEFVSDIFDVIK